MATSAYCLEDSVNDAGSVPARIQVASRSGYNEFWEPGQIVSGAEAFNPGWINADGCDNALIVLILTKSARRIGTRFHRLVRSRCRRHVYGVCESDTPTCRCGRLPSAAHRARQQKLTRQPMAVPPSLYAQLPGLSGSGSTTTAQDAHGET